MANFPTHIAVGTLVAGTLATLTVAADVVAPENLVAVTLAGVLGSVLPDIDLKDSRPARAMFAGLAVFFAFAVLFSAAGHYSIAEMLILYVGTLVAVQYGAKYIFHKFSYHRGIWHSILAAVFVSFVTATVYYYLLARPDAVCWLAAGFMFIGYMTHLTLDEIYSVDVMDTRLKRSFGTAIKLVDRKHPGHSAVMALATALAYLTTPPAGLFVHSLQSQPMWASLQRQMLPPRGAPWFGIDVAGIAARAKGHRADLPAPAISDVTTGSIAPAPPADQPLPAKPSN